METYVCLIMNHQRQILTVEALATETEAEARHRAQKLAAATLGAETFQLWRKGKKLAFAADGDGGEVGSESGFSAERRR